MSKLFSYYGDECVNDSKKGFLGKLSGTKEWSSLKDLLCLLKEHHGVCGKFKDNYRNGDNFEESYCLFFDFDTGLNDFESVSKQLIESGNDTFGAPISHLIVASKNHLKDKDDGKGVIQRFHLYIELSSPITDIDYYKFLWSELGKSFNWILDESCKTPTKYAYKHPKGLTGKVGKPLPTEFLQETFKQKQEESIRATQKRFNKLDSTFNLELFMKTHNCTNLAVKGNRHKAIVSLTKTIQGLGFGYEEVMQLLDTASYTYEERVDANKAVKLVLSTPFKPKGII